MRKNAKWTLVVAATPLFAAVGCESFISLAARTSRDWQFVQSVGGMVVGTPQSTSRGHFLLPVRCDVSGTKAITVRPTAGSSALVCELPIVRIRSSTVFLTIRTTLAAKRNLDARCPPADLGALTAGDYSVIYLSPDGTQHPLGSIKISSQ